MMHHLKEIVLTIIILSLYMPLHAQHGITAQYQSFSLEERIRIMAMMQQAYERAGQEIQSLEQVIINYLSQDIDEEFRTKLNNYYSEVQAVKQQYQQQGLKGIKARLDSIYDRLNRDIVNYNNLIAQRRNNNPSPSNNWTGTGFALKNGYIVTNYHVIDNAAVIHVHGFNGNMQLGIAASVFAVDKVHDLAIIKVYNSNGVSVGDIPYAISNQTLDVGEDVWTLGFPLTQLLGNEIKLTNGIVSSRSGYKGDYSLYQITTPVQPGNSGGPLFDSKGNVVGIVNAGVPGADNVGYAIKGSYLIDLLSRNNLLAYLPNNNSISSLTLKEQVKRIKNCVFLLKCSISNVNETSKPVSVNSKSVSTSSSNSYNQHYQQSSPKYDKSSSKSSTVSGVNSSLNSKSRFVVWGKCYDEFGVPVSDARVFNINTQEKRYTTSDGQFAISAKLGDTLIIQKKGYETETIAPKRQNIHSVLCHVDDSSGLNIITNNDISTTRSRNNIADANTYSWSNKTSTDKNPINEVPNPTKASAKNKCYEIAGMVIDNTGTPLYNAAIKNLTTKEKVVLSDNNGAFRINAHRGDTVSVSKPGFKSRTIVIKKNKSIKKIVLFYF